MEIRKDVVRTHPTLQFYTEPKDNLGIRRHAAIERILFIWAKLNGNLYVQGMNEIVGTICYVLANDKSKYPMNNNNSNNNISSSDDYWSNYAEYDTYPSMTSEQFRKIQLYTWNGHACACGTCIWEGGAVRSFLPLFQSLVRTSPTWLARMQHLT